MPEKKQNRITRTNADGTQYSKIDSWIPNDVWDALELYMTQETRKRAPAIAILLRKSLELEGLMKGVK